MIKFNEVTWYSKLAAVIFFIGVLPVLTFYIGIQYQKTNEFFIPETTLLDESNSNTDSDLKNTSTIQYEMITINNFLIPQINNFENQNSMEKVNSYFLELARNSKCSKDMVPMEYEYYELRTNVSYAQDDIFSTEIHASYNCGGPYPTNDSNSSVTFDMRTGEIVKYEDLFANYEKNKKAILTLIFEKQINEDNSQKDSTKPNDPTLCTGHYSSPINLIEQKYDGPSYFFDNLSYTLNKEGLSAQPSFPHVIAVCSKVGTASTESLRPYFDSSSILSRIK